MPTERTARVAEVIRRELASLMPRAVELEGQLITISGVKILPDLKQAFVYLSLIGQSMPDGEVLRIINKYKREWQAEIGKRMSTKFTPRLVFEIDRSVERGDRIMQVLHEIEIEQKVKKNSQVDI